MAATAILPNVKGDTVAIAISKLGEFTNLSWYVNGVKTTTPDLVYIVITEEPEEDILSEIPVDTEIILSIAPSP